MEEGQIGDFSGGTSFVAPQLNGVTALFVQALGGPVGQIGPNIAYGDNWGYKALAGYDDAAGIGKLDATRLLTGLAALRR